MRITFVTTAHPKSLAKALKASLASHGIDRGRNHCEELIAKMSGYTTWHELHQVCATRPEASPRDADVNPAVVSSRHEQYISALTAAGVEQSIAAAIIATIQPTGERLKTVVTAKTNGVVENDPFSRFVDIEEIDDDDNYNDDYKDDCAAVNEYGFTDGRKGKHPETTKQAANDCFYVYSICAKSFEEFNKSFIYTILLSIGEADNDHPDFQDETTNRLIGRADILIRRPRDIFDIEKMVVLIGKLEKLLAKPDSKDLLAKALSLWGEGLYKEAQDNAAYKIISALANKKKFDAFVLKPKRSRKVRAAA